jgi:hypothetical protein
MNNIKYLFAVKSEIVLAMVNNNLTGLSDADFKGAVSFKSALFDVHGHCSITTKLGCEPQWEICDATDLHEECLILTLVEGE